MKKRKGFTLIELLVVIAIIALLMSVLMPAMARVRSQAKSSACLSQLHSWGLMFKLYAEDNGGQLGDGNWVGSNQCYDTGPGRIGARRGYREWVAFLRPYYDNDYRLTTCPMATKPWSLGGRGKNSAWGVFPGVSGYNGIVTDWTPEHDAGYSQAMSEKAWEGECPGDRGSYGVNSWCYGLPENRDNLAAGKTGFGRDLPGLWRTVNVQKAGEIPLLVDALWLAGSPRDDDEPSPLELGVTEQQGALNNMNRFCVDRHNGSVNAAFLDFSAKPVGLKELWILKWSRVYTTDDPIGNEGAVQTIQTLGAWPAWMVSFKDYFSLVP